jgi:hypothetical protein
MDDRYLGSIFRGPLAGATIGYRPRYKAQLFNELYFLAAGGAVWFDDPAARLDEGLLQFSLLHSVSYGKST